MELQMSKPPRNWRLNRDMRLKREAVTMLKTMDHMASSFGYSHQTTLEMFSRILLHIVKARGEVKAYVEGYRDSITDGWYRNNLVWCHVSPEGKFYTSHKEVPEWAESVDPLYKADRGAEISTWQSGHYWKNGKPFFVSKQKETANV